MARKKLSPGTLAGVTKGSGNISATTRAEFTPPLAGLQASFLAFGRLRR